MQQLAEACIADSNAARVRLASLHMTLMFLGGCDSDETERAGLAADAIAASPFEVRLDRCEYRRRQAIVWLRGVSSKALTALVDDLRAGLQRADVPFDPKPFLPHVSLGRKVRSATPADCDLKWTAHEFVLMRSAPSPDGSRYQAIGRWPLKQ